MSTLHVTIKHGGKTYSVTLDTSQPPTAFKQAIFELTGVPTERMKVMTKAGVLKDDTPWTRVAPKAGQTFMVVGAAGELPKAPEKPVVFLEDLGDTELAEALKMPVGLTNLGNTCYMNATLQTLRAIPELQTALQSYNAPPQAQDGGARLTTSLRHTFGEMARTADGFTPAAFLALLRQLVPQFSERSQHGPGFAQQDAEECWTQIVNYLGVLPGAPVTPLPGGEDLAPPKFVEQYMMGNLTTEMKNIEAPEEPPTTTVEHFKTLPCNITINTNYMQQGIADNLDQTIEKQSELLLREAQYAVKARISRLPANLVVHMVRFAWKRDINKKAKIMRKVKFPFELDAAEWCTDALRALIRPASEKAKEIERERRERVKVRRKTKSALGGGAPAEGVSTTSPTPAPAADGDVPMADAGGDLEPEETIRARERGALDALVHPVLRADVGASTTGLYELAGVVAHKGASADGGHYIAFVRRDAFESVAPGEEKPEGEEEWFKFDDEKVSVVNRDRIVALEGGGEDAVAYVLLYR
ncbi:cysteine proteinase [Auricularia subglabra TFB-10046 SS5]|nr:cysteine proteinase [Auricularia subglabra TFB-10046 SS5]